MAADLATRPGDAAGQSFARSLGAVWAGDRIKPPEMLDAAIIFAPAGWLIPAALATLRKGAASSAPAST
jgi:propanol-preferring alcohol dehydrogenase